jgi:hypothetical protein
MSKAKMEKLNNICRVLKVNFETKQVERITEIKTTFHLGYDEYNIKEIDNNGKVQEFYYIESVSEVA